MYKYCIVPVECMLYMCLMLVHEVRNNVIIVHLQVVIDQQVIMARQKIWYYGSYL